jgi:hypothetical protein
MIFTKIGTNILRVRAMAQAANAGLLPLSLGLAPKSFHVGFVV